MEKDEEIDSDEQATKLDMWAASLLAHRQTEDGYQVGHNAQLIKADSEGAAEEIAYKMAREKFPEEGWKYSVALNQIVWNAKDVELGSVSFRIRIDR
jgi:hypothetical protein